MSAMDVFWAAPPISSA
ncbi:hypothetical protein BCIN_03g09290 [Botrytis cinerea B05.10]|uniref:Reelin domain-containing protein n=1 Tax=Botryotinia fuckeliana (strain B05.10) TaxID=332648 RepID=A0A384JEM1_BOTFB|nr:hypothetical protein BCIN_03g09290 [Botrytis cinerea B05.10]